MFDPLVIMLLYKTLAPLRLQTIVQHESHFHSTLSFKGTQQTHDSFNTIGSGSAAYRDLMEYTAESRNPTNGGGDGGTTRRTGARTILGMKILSALMITAVCI